MRVVSLRVLSMLLCSVALLFTAVLSATQLSIEPGQIRMPMPGRTVTAAYLTIYNQQQQAVTLIAASSPAFERVEIHTHLHQDGVMRMVRLDKLDLAAEQSVTFQPGGLHLMLFNPQQELTEGLKIPLTLEFADGQTLHTELPVVAMPRR